MAQKTEWHRVAGFDPLEDNSVTSVAAGVKALCLVKFEGQYCALDNYCPHQGGPLGEGLIENGFVVCPWHGYEYAPQDGSPPGGYDDRVESFPLEQREDGIYVAVEPAVAADTVSKQMIEVATDWGIDACFGMVGHSNLALADAIRAEKEKGRLRFVGVRHEGAASFAASGYAKLTGKPAMCLGIAGPGSTNLLTGLWDAKVDRALVIALSGQVQTQVLGPGAFQEIDLSAAFHSVAEWSQTVLSNQNASELMALAIKHAVVKRDVSHLIFPDEVAFSPGLNPRPKTPRQGRISTERIRPPQEQLDEAAKVIEDARLVTIIMGHGAKAFKDEIIALAEKIEAPVITTFKAKGFIADGHPLACGVLGRPGTIVGSTMMGRADVLLVFGASFSNHTGISQTKKIIQVDFDRMTLGKFHPVNIPLWGDIGVTCEALAAALAGTNCAESRHYLRREIAGRWQLWRAEKALRARESDKYGTNSARLFAEMSTVVVGGGGFGQYAMELTTAVQHQLPIKLVLLNNSEIGKISKEQRGVNVPVWATSLVNPDFAEFARSCGAWGKRVSHNDDIRAGLEELSATKGPGILECMTDTQDLTRHLR